MGYIRGSLLLRVSLIILVSPLPPAVTVTRPLQPSSYLHLLPPTAASLTHAPPTLIPAAHAQWVFALSNSRLEIGQETHLKARLNIRPFKIPSIEK